MNRAVFWGGLIGTFAILIFLIVWLVHDIETALLGLAIFVSIPALFVGAVLFWGWLARVLA